MEKTQLEKYHAKGWLIWGDTRISADDRLEAGKRFYNAYLACRFEQPVPDITQPRVDRTPHYSVAEGIQKARDYYTKALKCLDSKSQKAILRTVIIENKPVIIPRTYPGYYNHQLELSKEFLSRGLDKLFVFFGGKKVRLPKFRSYSEVPFWEGIEEYIKTLRK